LCAANDEWTYVMSNTMATIYHNSSCGTSRNTLALIRHAGIEPTIVDYLSQPPSRVVLVELIAAAGLTPREALREKGTPYAERAWIRRSSATTICLRPCWRILC
jgi:arsenate reductase (glutaredoxin)